MSGQYHEAPGPESGYRSLPLRWTAIGLSYIFHPIFIPVYVAGYLLFVHPLLFAGYDVQARTRLLASVFVNLCFLPAVTVFLAKRLRFVEGFQMNTRRERIIPLAAAMVFYFWCWFALKNFNTLPELFRQFLLGCFITIIAAWLANIYYKVSLHGLAAGGMVGFLLILVFSGVGGSPLYLALAVLAAGAVCSARMLLGAHRSFEVYSAFLIGVFCQFLAGWL